MRTGEHYQRYYGVYLASVIDVADPENLGRVRVECDQFRDSEEEAAWATVARPAAGDNSVFFSPKIGDQVVLGYLVGDANAPIVLGYAHSTKPDQTPPKGVARKVDLAGRDPIVGEQLLGPNRHGILTDTFHIELNETEGNRRMRLTNRCNGDYIEIDAEDNTMTLSAMNALVLKAAGIVHIEAPQVQINRRGVAAGTRAI